MNAFIHKSVHTLGHAGTQLQHTNTRPSVKELEVNQDADERQLNTHIPS